MIDTKELRRLAQAAIAKMNASDPEFASSTPPLAILELLERLDSAEKERANANAAAVDIALEAERLQVEIDALRAKIEAAEKERDDVAQQLVQSEQGKRKISKECETYKAIYNVWADKTEWVQQGFNEGTISAKYLGLHRADVMARLLDEAEKERDALRAEIEELHVLIAVVKKQANAEYRIRVKKEEEYARLRAKLEAAEKKHDDVAQQLVQSEIGKREISEAHNALQVEVGKLKDLEVSRCVKINGYIVDNARLAEEVERLRAKIEAMERQEPAGKFIQHPSNGLWEQDGYGDNPDARPLYALPGAKGEEK